MQDVLTLTVVHQVYSRKLRCLGHRHEEMLDIGKRVPHGAVHYEEQANEDEALCGKALWKICQ